jgi:hypothetical protein
VEQVTEADTSIVGSEYAGNITHLSSQSQGEQEIENYDEDFPETDAENQAPPDHLTRAETSVVEPAEMGAYSVMQISDEGVSVPCNTDQTSWPMTQNVGSNPLEDAKGSDATGILSQTENSVTEPPDIEEIMTPENGERTNGFEMQDNEPLPTEMHEQLDADKIPVMEPPVVAEDAPGNVEQVTGSKTQYNVSHLAEKHEQNVQMDEIDDQPLAEQPRMEKAEIHAVTESSVIEELAPGNGERMNDSKSYNELPHSTEEYVQSVQTDAKPAEGMAKLVKVEISPRKVSDDSAILLGESENGEHTNDPINDGVSSVSDTETVPEMEPKDGDVTVKLDVEQVGVEQRVKDVEATLMSQPEVTTVEDEHLTKGTEASLREDFSSVDPFKVSSLDLEDAVRMLEGVSLTPSTLRTQDSNSDTHLPDEI